MEQSVTLHRRLHPGMIVFPRTISCSFRTYSKLVACSVLVLCTLGLLSNSMTAINRATVRRATSVAARYGSKFISSGYKKT